MMTMMMVGSMLDQSVEGPAQRKLIVILCFVDYSFLGKYTLMGKVATYTN